MANLSNRQSTPMTAIMPPSSSRTLSASRAITSSNYCFPKAWPNDREQRARIIGEWLQTEARFLA